MARATYSKPFPSNAVKNKGATIIYGKTNGFVTQALGRTTVGLRTGTSGSKVIPPLHEAALNFTGKILSSGPFAQMRINKYMIRKVTKEIATIANTSLYLGPNTSWRRSIAFNESQVSLVLRGAVINYFTGQYTTNIGVQRDQLGNDVAAHPTRLVPGKVLVNYGNVVGGVKKPVTKTYTAKNT